MATLFFGSSPKFLCVLLNLAKNRLQPKAHERLSINSCTLPHKSLYNVLDCEKKYVKVWTQPYKQEKLWNCDEIKISFMTVLLKYYEKSNFGKKVAYKWNHDLMFYHLSLLYHLKQLQRSVLLYLAGYRLWLPCLLTSKREKIFLTAQERASQCSQHGKWKQHRFLC